MRLTNAELLEEKKDSVLEKIYEIYSQRIEKVHSDCLPLHEGTTVRSFLMLEKGGYIYIKILLPALEYEYIQVSLWGENRWLFSRKLTEESGDTWKKWHDLTVEIARKSIWERYERDNGRMKKRATRKIKKLSEEEKLEKANAILDLYLD